MKSAFLILCSCALVGGILFGGYKWGYQVGHQSATDQVTTETNITNCVYLTLASRKGLDGDLVMARDLRNRLLFTSAMELDEIIASGRLGEVKARNARSVVQDVVDHYWKHPDESLLSSQDHSLTLLKPKFTAFLRKYSRAEQIADGKTPEALKPPH